MKNCWGSWVATLLLVARDDDVAGRVDDVEVSSDVGRGRRPGRLLRGQRLVELEVDGHVGDVDGDRQQEVVPPLPSKFMYRPVPRPATVPLAPRKFDR